MHRTPPILRPGPLSRTDADRLNVALAELYRLTDLRPAAPLYYRQGPGGTQLLVDVGAVIGGVNLQTSSYTFQPSDDTKLVSFSSTSALTGTLPAASSLGAKWLCSVENRGTGTLTLQGSTLSAPAAPSLSSGTGGSIGSGTYQVEVSYVNAQGETVASSSSSITLGSGATLTITSPAASGSGTGAATGWYAYVTQASGSTYYRQQTAGSPTAIGTNLTLAATPTTSGANPPTSNSASLSTIDGAGSLAIAQNQGCELYSDGANYFTERGMGGGGSDPVFLPAGATHAAGDVPDPGATAHTPPYVLGDDAAFHELLGTKGDVLGTTGSAFGQLAVGTDGQVLTARSTASLGFDWETPSGGGGVTGTYNSAVLATTTSLSTAPTQLIEITNIAAGTYLVLADLCATATTATTAGLLEVAGYLAKNNVQIGNTWLIPVYYDAPANAQIGGSASAAVIVTFALNDKVELYGLQQDSTLGGTRQAIGGSPSPTRLVIVRIA